MTTGNPILQLFGRDLQVMPERLRDRWTNRAFCYWRRQGFPFPSLTPHEIESQFNMLMGACPTAILHNGTAKASMIGLSLANSFHPQMWSVTKRGRSPIECFLDNSVLRKCLKKAFQFWPHRRCWNAQCIRSLIRIYHRGRVSNFRPTVARAIAASYSGRGATVLDFTAGYGGRMLGCLTLDRHYIGIDAERAQVRGLRRLGKAVRAVAPGTYEIHQGCAEVVLKDIPSDSVDLVLTSPPYFNNEEYSRSSFQSYRRYPIYEVWRDRFLRPVITQSRRILRRGGRLVLNVADTGSHPVASDVRQIALEGFVLERTIKLLLNRMPLQRAKAVPLYRWEPIFVFVK